MFYRFSILENNFLFFKALQKISTEGVPGVVNAGAWSEELNDFIRLCIEVDNFNRPTAAELLQHPITDPQYIPPKYFFLILFNDLNFLLLHH